MQAKFLSLLFLCLLSATNSFTMEQMTLRKRIDLQKDIEKYLPAKKGLGRIIDPNTKETVEDYLSNPNNRKELQDKIDRLRTASTELADKYQKRFNENFWLLTKIQEARSQGKHIEEVPKKQPKKTTVKKQLQFRAKETDETEIPLEQALENLIDRATIPFEEETVTGYMASQYLSVAFMILQKINPIELMQQHFGATIDSLMKEIPTFLETNDAFALDKKKSYIASALFRTIKKLTLQAVKLGLEALKSLTHESSKIQALQKRIHAIELEEIFISMNAIAESHSIASKRQELIYTQQILELAHTFITLLDEPAKKEFQTLVDSLSATVKKASIAQEEAEIARINLTLTPTLTKKIKETILQLVPELETKKTVSKEKATLDELSKDMEEIVENDTLTSKSQDLTYTNAVLRAANKLLTLLDEAAKKYMQPLIATVDAATKNAQETDDPIMIRQINLKVTPPLARKVKEFAGTLLKEAKTGDEVPEQKKHSAPKELAYKNKPSTKRNV